MIVDMIIIREIWD